MYYQRLKEESDGVQGVMKGETERYAVMMCITGDDVLQVNVCDDVF